MKLKLSRRMTAMMLVLSLGILAMSILQPMLPLYLVSIDISPGAAGLMLSVAMVGMFIGEIYWGWVADKTGFMLPVGAGTFLSGLTVLCFVFTKNTGAVFAIFFFWGLVRAALFGPVRGYIGANAPASRKVTFMAINSVMMSASRGIGSFPSGFLVDNLGFNSVFFVSCGISISAGVIVFGRLRSKPDIFSLPDVSAGIQEDKYLKTAAEKADYSLFAVRCGITTLQFAGLGIFTGFLPLLASKVSGISAAGIGILFTIYSIAAMLVSIPMGMLADRRGSKNGFIALGLVVSCAAMAGMAVLHSFAWLAVFVIMSGIGMAIFSPAALTVVSDSFSIKQQSTVMGLYGAFGENIGIIAGFSMGGFLWSILGPQYTFMAGAASSAAGLVLVKFSLMLEKHKNSKLQTDID